MRDKFISEKKPHMNKRFRKDSVKFICGALLFGFVLFWGKVSPAIDSAQIILPPTQAQANDVWQKILILTSKRNGYVSKEDFEKMFKVSLGKADYIGMDAKSYTIYQGRGWIFDANIVNAINVPATKDGKASTIGVTFKNYTVKDAAKMNPCIPAFSAIDAMTSRGWRPVTEGASEMLHGGPQITMFYSRNGEGHVYASITHIDGCLDSFSLSTNGDFIQYKPRK